MTDEKIPEGIDAERKRACCDHCGKAMNGCGPFRSPPRGWFTMRVNFNDGDWPPLQPMNSDGSSTLTFCSPDCACVWMLRWGDACVAGAGPEPRPTDVARHADDPPRYLRLRPEGES